MGLVEDVTLQKKSEMEAIAIETVQNETEKGKIILKMKNVSEQWDNFKQPKICVTRTHEGGEREKVQKRCLRIQRLKRYMHPMFTAALSTLAQI